VDCAFDDNVEKTIWEPLAGSVGLTHIVMVKLRLSIATCGPLTSPVPVNRSAPLPIFPGVAQVGPAEIAADAVAARRGHVPAPHPGARVTVVESGETPGRP
jgi:hypothetical protein